MYNWYILKMLWAPRTIQEFNSKTYGGSGHGKNKWIQHIEQTGLCYTEKSPTGDIENIYFDMNHLLPDESSSQYHVPETLRPRTQMNALLDVIAEYGIT